MGDEDKTTACKVFVGGLTLNTTVDDLRSYFGQYGEIVDAVVMKDGDTKRSRGFGFVTFKDPQSVDDCLVGAPHVVDDKTVEAKRAIPREATRDSSPPSSSSPQCKKVFLGGLSVDTEEKDIREVLEEIGPLEVEGVSIITEKESGRPRGFGFAIFQSPESVNKLCTRRYIKIKDRDVEVKKAVSQEDMRKTDGGSRGRYAPQQGGYRDQGYGSAYGDGGGRNSYSAYPRGGGGGGAGVYPATMGGYDYRGYGMADYDARSQYYQYSGAYDRNAASSAYAAYANTYGRGGYDMQAAAYGMYGAAAAGMSGGYNQTPANYTPARAYSSSTTPMTGATVEYGKDRTGATRQQAYHPYRRNQ